MPKETEDRRKRRTKKLLKQGFAELMQEKDFKDITVRDITDRMDLNRGTFYLHYSDTYDLLQNIESDTISDVQSMIDEQNINCEKESLQGVFESILNYIIENKVVFYSLFTNKTSSNFMDKMHSLIYENGSQFISTHYTAVPANRVEFLLSYITYGLIGIIKHWFDTNMSLDKKELLSLADKLALMSVKGVAQQ